MPETLYQQLENERMKVDLLQHEINFRAQREKQLIKEVEELHKAVRMREDLVSAERNKEKEVIKKNFSDYEHKIEYQKEKIKELSSVVQDITSKNKASESKVQLLEMTIKELETSNK